MESFSHYDVIDKHGNRVAEGHKASFCLEDSECNRGTFPKYNCQNWGQQGKIPWADTKCLKSHEKKNTKYYQDESQGSFNFHLIQV